MPTQHTPSLSLPRTKTVRGYEIKRLALGGYLSAVQRLQDLPGDLMRICFPGQGLGEILERLKTADEALLRTLLQGALTAAPQHLIRVVAGLTGIPQDRLIEDDAIGLDGLVEILTAFVEVNRLEDFIPAVRSLGKTLRTAMGSSPGRTTGCSG